MRIWHQSFTDLEKVPLYERTLIEHAATVVGPGTDVTVHGLRPGTYGDDLAPIDAIRHRYLEFLNEGQICEAALAAEAADYDAVALGCFFDPGLTQARSLVDIPVVGIAETNMSIALTLGERFAMIALNRDQQRHYEDLVRRYRLESRFAAAVPMDPPIDEYSLESEGPAADAIATGFERACRAALGAGAEVIIPADGVLNEFVWRHGFTEHGGATVVDSIGLLFRYTEFVVGARTAIGLETSRIGRYARPDDAAVAHARAAAGLRPSEESIFSGPVFGGRT